MRAPLYGYAIFPLDKNGNVAGVYVGSTGCIKQRITGHIASKKVDPQRELHNLMRENGFKVIELYKVDKYENRWLEAVWMDIFSKYTNLKVFNQVVGGYTTSRVAKVYKKYWGVKSKNKGLEIMLANKAERRKREVNDKRGIIE